MKHLYRNQTLLAAAMACSLAPAVWAQQTTFVSIPDFWNMDYGDISTLSTYDGGANSWTAGYESAMNYMYDAVAAENPDFVMAAGDMVMGHWDHDVNNRQIFGNTSTLAGKQAAINTAADFYYGIWKDGFTSRGITNIYAAVGDHEIGDDNGGSWTGTSATVVPTYKEAFARNFTSGFTNTPNAGTASDPVTSYAVQHGNILLVTLDQYDYDSSTNTVDTQISSSQQTWLDNLLATTTADHVFVQGHMPIDDSPTVPARNSSQLKYDGGTASPLWQSMVNGGADIYFAGEVHDDSVRNNAGEDLIQVITGGIIGESSTGQYLVGTVDGDVITLEVKEFAMTNIGSSSSTGGLWQTGSNRPHADVAVTDPLAAPATIGTVTIDKSSGSTVFYNATGTFASLASLGPGLLDSGFLDLTGDIESFDGTAGSVLGTGTSAEDLNIDGTGAKTLVARFLTETDGRQGLISYSPSGATGEALRLVIDDGKLRLETNNAFAEYSDLSLDLADGEYHTIAAVISAGGYTDEIDLYIDGVLLEPTSSVRALINTLAQATGSNPDDIIIGNTQDGNNSYFTGTIDWVGVYDQALTVEQINAIPEPTTGLVLSLGGLCLLRRRR